MATYKEAKLSIFEKAAAGLVTESQRDELLALLEAKKAESELTPEAINDFFDNLEDMYPDLKEDIEKLAKKIEKAAGDDGDENESSDKEEGDDGEQVSEAAMELMSLIDSM